MDHSGRRKWRFFVQIKLNNELVLVNETCRPYCPDMAKKGHPHAGPGAPTLTPNVAEMRALAHPLRLRIMELFAEAPRTTKQVADLLGQPPTRLYHHVAALERAGLLRLKETRKNRGTVEKWYESIARALGSPTRQAAGSKRRGGGAKKSMVMAMLEQSRQEV